MPIRLNATSPTPPDAGASSAQSSAGSPSDLDQQLNRARQALARGDLSPTEVAKLRSLLTMANRALSRGDAAKAQRFADEAEKTSGNAPGAPSDRPAGDSNQPGQTDDAGQKDAPPADDATKLGDVERRTYQDASSDPGVSFKQPTKLTPGQAEVLVRFHERQHLRRDTQEARAEGKKVVSAYTAVQYRTDPATGKRYVKGGKTVIQTATDQTPKIDKKA
ncbi:MAG: hypothetical protein EXS64_19845 [Candidatus Latescibacteria bacterium]|nr:hypothetical protein [Candidatus Latescibacterota bacterium]